MKESEKDRINKILNHDLFIKCVCKNEKAEEGRKFCRHDITHFLDVARLAELLNLYEKQEVDKELIYAAALLHDIGRHIQYEDKTPHELASAELAVKILEECGFDDKEASVIIRAIRNHRNSFVQETLGIDGLLYRADKMSRSCFACKVQKECDWKEEKKNRSLIW